MIGDEIRSMILMVAITIYEYCLRPVASIEKNEKDAIMRLIFNQS